MSNVKGYAVANERWPHISEEQKSAFAVGADWIADKVWELLDAYEDFEVEDGWRFHRDLAALVGWVSSEDAA